MTILIIENNLAGFFTAVYHNYYIYNKGAEITCDHNEASLLDEALVLSTDLELARRVRKGIIAKVGKLGYKDIADAYLSGDPDKEKKISLYLDLVFQQGKNIFTMYDNPAVINFNEMLNRVRYEVHRLHGFIRFQEMQNGIYYSFFGSDNDILELLLPHFTLRFNSQQFILHDIRRKKMAYYDGTATHCFDAPSDLTVTLSDREKLFKELWREYNRNVAIDSRKNTKLQNHYAPKRYRWFMNEF